MTGQRVIHVSREFVDAFEGWLEFAGMPEHHGVPYCAEWPQRFTITRTEITEDDCGPQSIRDCVSYLVRSPEWPRDENRCWTPTISRSVAS